MITQLREKQKQRDDEKQELKGLRGYLAGQARILSNLKSFNCTSGPMAQFIIVQFFFSVLVNLIYVPIFVLRRFYVNHRLELKIGLSHF